MTAHKTLTTTLLVSLVIVGSIGIVDSLLSRTTRTITKVMTVTVTPTIHQQATISATPSATPRPTVHVSSPSALPQTPSFAKLCNDPHFYNDPHYVGYCSE